MIYDRDYMRDGDRPRWGSPVVLLLIGMVAIFLLECVLVVHEGWTLSKTFGLSLPAVRQHEYWRLVTYQFLHQAPWPWHVLFNGIALWLIGRSLLDMVGVAGFWRIFLSSGLAGAFVELAAQAWNPAYGHGLTVGASACVLGLLGAYCLLSPDRDIVFFLYIIPIRLRAMTMFWVTLGYAIFGTIFPHGGIAHAAHLGGILAGAAFVKLFIHEEAWLWLRRVMPRPVPRVLRPPVPVTAIRVAGRTVRSEVPVTGEMESAEDFIRREVDPILDKISAHGLHSLTEQERRVLERARERMRGPGK